MSNNTQSIDIIIDTHEDKLISALESDYLKKECDHMIFEISTLEVGDVILKHNETILCIIERKTNEDYASSITDGRLKNQSIRMSQLKKENPNIIIIYLIEGGKLSKDHKFRNGVTRDALYTSMINRVIRDHFIIYRTMDINDTALVITKLYDRMLEHVQNDQTTCVSDERIDYLKTIKLSKKDNMTPNNCYLCQLSQIPGVSIDMANVIVQQYSSMSQLIMAYEKNNSQKDREGLLSDLQISIANNKTRRLGGVLSKRIYEYLYGITNQKIVLKVKKI